MAKGQQKQQGLATGAPGPNGSKHKTKSAQPHVVQADLYQRANFTLQASSLLQHLQSGPVTVPDPGSRLLNDENRDNGTKCDLHGLSKNIMSANARMVVHNQMKLDTSMKRNVCDVCSTVLIPGLTCKIRNRPHRHHMNVTNTSCLACQAQRSIPCPPTSTAEPKLDGKKRAARREKLARKAKIPFHNREAGATEKGHTLWRQQVAIENWGERFDSHTTVETKT